MADKGQEQVRRYTVAVKLNRAERDALNRLTHEERLPAAQVLRRLLWQAAERMPKQEARHA